jgi:hypothetical protein
MSTTAVTCGTHARRHFLLAGVLLISFACLCLLPSDPGAPPKTDCPHPDTAQPVDSTDPIYRIIAPNGDEVFSIGQQCTVKVASSRPAASAALYVLIGKRQLVFSPPPFNEEGVSLPGGDTVRTMLFTIPDSLESQRWDPATQEVVTTRISSVTDSCIIKIQDYGNPLYSDYSDCYFRIAKKK